MPKAQSRSYNDVARRAGGKAFETVLGFWVAAPLWFFKGAVFFLSKVALPIRLEFCIETIARQRLLLLIGQFPRKEEKFFTCNQANPLLPRYS